MVSWWDNLVKCKSPDYQFDDQEIFYLGDRLHEHCIDSDL